MAAEAQSVPEWARDQSNFAQAWVARWRAYGGVVSIGANGARMLWYPLTPSAERRAANVDAILLNDGTAADRCAARRAMLALLDAAGPAAKNAVFAAVAGATS